jgi:hypothetical protein
MELEEENIGLEIMNQVHMEEVALGKLEVSTEL